MNPRTTCCRRNLRPRHRRLRRSAQAAASASVGSWRLPFAIATFKARFVISSHLENPAKVAVAAVTRVPVSIASAPFPALPHQSSPLSTNLTPYPPLRICGEGERNGEIVPPLHECGEGDRG